MRWITFLILLYLMSALQMANLGAFPHGAKDSWPGIEYLPLLAIFYALFAMESAAPLAALLCGAMYDVINGDFIGTSMVPLALVAWLLVRIRLSIFREHAISQVIMTLLAILVFGIFSTVFRKMVGAPLHGLAALPHVGRLGGNSMYTAIVAPVAFWVFFRFRQMLGFSPHGARGRG